MTHEVAVIEGDGIGREVIPAAVAVLDAVADANDDVDFAYVEAEAGDAEEVVTRVSVERSSERRSSWPA